MHPSPIRKNPLSRFCIIQLRNLKKQNKKKQLRPTLPSSRTHSCQVEESEMLVCTIIEEEKLSFDQIPIQRHSFPIKLTLIIFTNSAPLGPVGLRVAMSVCMSVCPSVCAIGCSFFQSLSLALRSPYFSHPVQSPTFFADKLLSVQYLNLTIWCVYCEQLMSTMKHFAMSICMQVSA